jgi:hypothetical protein
MPDVDAKLTKVRCSNVLFGGPLGWCALPLCALGIAENTNVKRNIGLPDWIWKSFIAGLCGTIAHTLLMFFKARTGLLPSFQPYQSLQSSLSHLVGSAVPPVVPWAISFVNGSTIVGLLFGGMFPLLPGTNGIVKGIVVGVFGWLLMGSLFFPLLGLGFFATGPGIGFEPALFALAMMLTYSVAMGIVFAALHPNLPGKF